MSSADRSIFTPDFKTDPYWWEAAPRPRLEPTALPASIDVAIVGSGYTGLCAARELARGGRSVLVIDAGDPGSGASSRSTGSIGRTFRHAFSALLKNKGTDYAIGVYSEVAAAFEYAAGLIKREGIECNFQRSGRITGAVVPQHYEKMARELEIRRRHLPASEILVAPGDLPAEIGFGNYHGGMVIPDVGLIHPGLYHLGLLTLAHRAGAATAANTVVTGLRRNAGGFVVATTRGTVQARDVVLATNGYTGSLSRFLQRRLIPFPAFIVATEPLDPDLLRRLLPTGRVFQESRQNPYFLRPTPDGTRLLFGGLTGSSTTDLRVMGARLHAEMIRIAPALAGTRLSHAWTGKCAATFSVYPRVGRHKGIHFAGGYCFAGISMGSYLGYKVAQQVLGSDDAKTVFSEVPFESRPYHWGRPWFLPIAVAKFAWKDRADARAAR